MAEEAADGVAVSTNLFPKNKKRNRPIKKQEFNRYFAVLLTGLSKKHKTGTKFLRKAIVPVLVLVGWEQSAQADPVTNFVWTGGFQTWTVQTTGLYDITAFGAQGGSSGASSGGFGAKIGGEFNLTAGTELKIAVGGVGGVGGNNGDTFSYGGGGGGGSFVIATDYVVGRTLTPMVIAGGGGGGLGANGTGVYHGGGGSSVVNGDRGGVNGGDGGWSGSGGNGSVDSGGGGGGGLYSGGGNSGGLRGGGGGLYGGGGGGSGFGSYGGKGGFGGGGGGGYLGGGGGGGYSGGGGGGGGAGSYLLPSSLNQILMGSYQAVNILYDGNGLVKIDFLGSGVESVPEPSAASLFGLGFAGLGVGFAVRRRRNRLAEGMS